MPTQLFEAAKISSDQLTGKTWRIKVIEGNRKGSSAYYPADVVEKGAPLFAKGTRIYGDHPTLQEKWDRPERSYKDIIGWLSEDSVFENGDLYANATFIESERERIKELAEAGVIGMSIRASGDVEETADGPVLKAFTSVSSVDVVTTAGAGGGFDKLLEAARENSASESGAESLEEKESAMDKELAAALDALVESGKKTAEAVALLVERADKEDKAKEALQEAERKAAEDAKAPTAADIAGKLVEAELPKPAQARVLALVEAGKDLDESIKAEKEYLEEALKSAPKFEGNGSEELQESSKSVGSRMFRS